MDVFKGVISAIGILIVFIAITVGGYLGFWWLTEDSTERQVSIDNKQKGTQQAWADEARSAIADFELIPVDNAAMRGALRNKACTLIVKLTDTYKTDELELFYQMECM